MTDAEVTMPSTSKSNRWRSEKSKFVSKPKQEWRVKQTTRNWLELPSDIMANILQRVGVIDVLENAQKVCTAWREICKDPTMWRVIHMDQYPVPTEWLTAYKKVCVCAVDRSQGKLVDLTITGFGGRELLKYVTDSSSQLRRLEIIYSSGGIQGEAFKNLSLLEELSLDTISQDVIEAVGRYCPLLKTLKVNKSTVFWNDNFTTAKNEMVLEIGKNLPRLTHLELVRNDMNNIGLQAILDGCCHLESLDLRGCFHLDLEGDLGKRCSQQIKDLKRPHDFLEGYSDFTRCNFCLQEQSSCESNGCCNFEYYELMRDRLARMI